MINALMKVENFIKEKTQILIPKITHIQFQRKEIRIEVRAADSRVGNRIIQS